MGFGVLKSKIEQCLIESYQDGTIKDNLFVFNELVKKNKNISKLFYLYNELKQNKGLNENMANKFIDESIVIYENTINKISKKSIDEINQWVGHVKTNNEYKEVDALFSQNVLTLENKIKGRNTILETLSSNPLVEKNVITNVSLDTIVNKANKTVKEYLSSLKEEEKKEVTNILCESDNTLKIKFEVIKENTLNRLENLKSSTDSETLKTINETIQKVKNETYDKISYVKLKKLNESL